MWRPVGTRKAGDDSAPRGAIDDDHDYQHSVPIDGVTYVVSRGVLLVQDLRIADEFTLPRNDETEDLGT